MREESVTFYSGGEPISALLRLPAGGGPHPGIVQGPGWLGLKDAGLYVRYHDALVAEGFAVLVIDYRGFGDSGGERGTLSPRMQLEDLEHAVTYLTTLEEVDARRIGVFGTGGTGGGNAVLLAAHDERVSCCVAQVPVADGADWLRRMRSSDAEWDAFQVRLEEDRRRRVLTGAGEYVHPREEIMIPSAERKATTVKKDVDDRIPSSVPLAAADEILRYRPIDAVSAVAGLCVIAVEGDEVTPTDHAVGLYERARPPKRLIMQHDTSHYAAYDRYGDVVVPLIVEWFETHIGGPAGSDADVVEVRG